MVHNNPSKHKNKSLNSDGWCTQAWVKFHNWPVLNGVRIWIPLDINECSSRHPCQDGCVNSDGSFTCTCPEGSELKVDGITCEDAGKCKKWPKSMVMEFYLRTWFTWSCHCSFRRLIEAQTKFGSYACIRSCLSSTGHVEGELLVCKQTRSNLFLYKPKQHYAVHSISSLTAPDVHAVCAKSVIFRIILKWLWFTFISFPHFVISRFLL